MPTIYLNNIVTGESRPLDLKGGSDDERYAEAVKTAQAEAQATGQSLMVSDQPLEQAGAASPPDGQGAPKVLSSQAEQAALTLPTPPIPKPYSPTELPPETSDTFTVSTEPSALKAIPIDNMWAPVHLLKPAFPSNTYLQFVTYWKRAGVATLTGPQTYTKSISYKMGMSVTDSVSLSAELGVSVKGLSAKLAETTGHSVTTSEETTITDSYTIDAPAGKTIVYALWQLVGQLLYLGPDEKTPVHWSGRFFMAPESYTSQPRLSRMNIVYSDQTAFDTPS